MKYAIEVELRRLFKAESALDDVQLFTIGEPPFVNLEDFPIVIIFAEQRLVFDEETGIWIYRYTGYIACETFIQDDYEVENREMDVISLLTVRAVLDSVTDVIEVNLSLGSLVDGTEKVRVIQVGNKNYGIRERDNNHLNRGEVDFLVETQKPRAG